MILRFFFVFFMFCSLSYPWGFGLFKKKPEKEKKTEVEVNILAEINPDDLRKVNDSMEGIKVNIDYSRTKKEINKRYALQKKRLTLEIRKLRVYYGRKIRTERKKEKRDQIAAKYKAEEAKQNQEIAELEKRRLKEIDKLTKQKDRKIYKLVQDRYNYQAYIDSYSNNPRDNYFIQVNGGLWLASNVSRVTVSPVNEQETMKVKEVYHLGYQPFYSLAVGYMNSSSDKHMEVEAIGTNLFTDEADIPSSVLSFHWYSFNYYFDFKGFSKAGYVVRSFVKTGIGIMTIQPTSEQELPELSFTVGGGYYGRLAKNLDWVAEIDVTTGQFKRTTTTDAAKVRSSILLNRIFVGLRYLL